MIFERLTLHNFQAFQGTSTIAFPEPGDSKTIVLVLGPNNTGKSTVLRALRFLFYGSLAKYSRENAWQLANRRARAAAPTGTNIGVWVEARLVIADKDPVTIRRELRVRRTGNPQDPGCGLLPCGVAKDFARRAHRHCQSEATKVPRIG